MNEMARNLSNSADVDLHDDDAWIQSAVATRLEVKVQHEVQVSGKLWPSYVELFPQPVWQRVVDALGAYPKLSTLVDWYLLHGLPVSDTEDVAFRVTGLGYCSVWRTDSLSERSYGFWLAVLGPGGLYADGQASQWIVGLDMGISVAYVGQLSVSMSRLMGLAEGWCYLKLVKQEHRFDIARALGPNPKVDDWLLAIHGKTLVPRDGTLWILNIVEYGQYHLELCGNPEMDQMPRLRFDDGHMSVIGLNTDWRVGGKFEGSSALSVSAMPVRERPSTSDLSLRELNIVEALVKSEKAGDCMLVVQFNSHSLDACELSSDDEGIVLAKPSIVSGGYRLYTVDVVNAGSPAAVFVPAGARYWDNGVHTDVVNDVVVVVGSATRFVVAELVEIAELEANRGRYVDKDIWGRVQRCLKLSFKRLPQWQCMLDPSSSDARAAAEHSRAYLPWPVLSRDTGLLEKHVRWTAIHDKLDTWRSLDVFRCDMKVDDGVFVQFPSYLNRRCVLVHGVRPAEVGLHLAGVTVSGDDSSVACNLMRTVGFTVKHRRKGKLRVSVRFSYVYDDYNYDEGGLSGSEDFESVFAVRHVVPLVEYSYEDFILPDFVGEARRVLGLRPVFGRLVKLPYCWFDVGKLRELVFKRVAGGWCLSSSVLEFSVFEQVLASTQLFTSDEMRAWDEDCLAIRLFSDNYIDADPEHVGPVYSDTLVFA